MAEADAGLSQKHGEHKEDKFANYLRFQRLLDEAKTIVRGLFDSIHNPSNLGQILQTHKPTLQGLRDRKIISSGEWRRLYPSDTTYGESKDFGLLLLIKLLRNICDLNTNKDLEGDLAQLEYYHNIS